MMRDEAIQAIADAFLLHPDHPVLMSDIPHASVAALDALLGWMRENLNRLGDIAWDSHGSPEESYSWAFDVLADLLSEGSER